MNYYFLIIISLFFKSGYSIITDINCEENVNVGIGDIYRIYATKDEISDITNCKYELEVAKDTQMMLECSKFDIGLDNYMSFDEIDFKFVDKQINNQQLNNKIIGQVNNTDNLNKVIQFYFQDHNDFNEYNCFIHGVEADSANLVAPLVPECGNQWSYLIKSGNEFAISSQDLVNNEGDCFLQFAFAKDVSASLRCQTFDLASQSLMQSVFKKTIIDIDEELFEFNAKDLDGKIIGYTSVNDDDQLDDDKKKLERRWSLELKNIDEQSNFDCIVTGIKQ